MKKRLLSILLACAMVVGLTACGGGATTETAPEAATEESAEATTESSDETPGVTGLGLLKGTINRIPDAPGLKIPHMGWNSLDVKEGATLFQGIPNNPYVYFVHSYYI